MNSAPSCSVSQGKTSSFAASLANQAENQKLAALFVLAPDLLDGGREEFLIKLRAELSQFIEAFRRVFCGSIEPIHAEIGQEIYAMAEGGGRERLGRTAFAKGERVGFGGQWLNLEIEEHRRMSVLALSH